MDPLALLPYALAAAGGRVDAHPATALIAAGVTLLQRSAPLVRALAGRRSAALMLPGPTWLVALAASDGRGVVVLSEQETITTERLNSLGVGAVFTTTRGAGDLPPGTPHVLLDHAPASARVVVGDRVATVDLGSHFALDLVGDQNSPGSPEECVLFSRDGSRYSHAEVLTAAREAMREHRFTPVDRTICPLPAEGLPALATGFVAPLLAGGMLHTHAVSVQPLTALVDAADPTIIVARSVDLVELHDRAQHVPALAARLERVKHTIAIG